MRDRCILGTEPQMFILLPALTASLLRQALLTAGRSPPPTPAQRQKQNF